MTDPAAPPSIELLDVCLRYGTFSALDRVSLRADPGSRIALVGPSGAGKTSLISLINASTQPSAGTVRVLGTEPSRLEGKQRRALRRRIATMHQQLFLPGSLRVARNVNAGRLGAWTTGHALRSLLRPGADDVRRAEDALGQLGIAHTIWRRTDELSGGERQRVALARLLVQDAELILADEPTSNLDPARAGEVLDLLLHVAESARTVLVSVHAFDLAVARFDRIVGLRAGRILFDLPAAEVSPARAAELYAIAPS